MVRQPEGSPVLAAILDAYEYDAIETCAGDGNCETACPVGINTGHLIKHFRHVEHTPRRERVAATLARNWRALEVGARVGLRAAHAAASVFGHGAMTGLTGAARAVVSTDLMPGWVAAMPKAATGTPPATRRDGAAAVYFTACVNRMFGRSGEQPERPTLAEALVAVSARAGLPLWIPTTSQATAARRSGTRRVTSRPTRSSRTGPSRASGGGLRAAGCPSSATRAPAPSASPARSSAT